MTRRTYTPEYKAKLVIEVLQGEKELNTIAAENSISPNMLRNWKAEFLENAGRVYTQIKIDEISNMGAVTIRLRSLFAMMK